jgi:ribosomal protein S18 acetylase RimI-like enzyme
MARVRRAVLEDAAAIARCQAMALATVGGWVADRPPPDVESRRLRWLDTLARPPEGVAAVFVIEQDGAVLGYAGCGPQRHAGHAALGFRGELVSIHVLPGQQRAGHGRALLGACTRRFLAHNITAASLRLPAGNAGARRFFVALGAHELPLPDERSRVALGWRNLVRLALG